MASKEHFNVNEYVKSVSSLTKYQILYNPTWTKVSKEYTYCDISSSKHLTLPTSPRSVCSIIYYTARLAEQAGRGWESQMFGRQRGGGVLSLLLLIYMYSLKVFNCDIFPELGM